MLLYLAAIYLGTETYSLAIISSWLSNEYFCIVVEWYLFWDTYKISYNAIISNFKKKIFAVIAASLKYCMDQGYEVIRIKFIKINIPVHHKSINSLCKTEQWNKNIKSPRAITLLTVHAICLHASEATTNP